MLRSMLALTAMAALAGPAGATEGRTSWLAALHSVPPGIRVWTSGGDLYHRGDRVRVFFRTERDAYVALLRVDTDGRVRLLYPRYPGEDNYVGGGTTYQVYQNENANAFSVDDDPGVGYVFGVASADPFDFEAMYAGDRWDVGLISDGRIHGDPLTSLEEVVTQLLPTGYGDFDTHLVPYYVDQRYEYPRFMCYDCHAYTPWMYWNPYAHWCPQYSLVLWYDPWYYYPSYWYPTRYYGGTRVVYTSPSGRGMYTFKSRSGSQPGIDYRDRRHEPAPGISQRRRSDVAGVRGTDIGGVGSIPAPRQVAGGAEGRRRSESLSAPRSPADWPQQQGGATRAPDGGRRRSDLETAAPDSRSQPPADARSRGSARGEITLPAELAPQSERTGGLRRVETGQATEQSVKSAVQDRRRGSVSQASRPQGAPAGRSPDARSAPGGSASSGQPRAAPSAPAQRSAPSASPSRGAPSSAPRSAPSASAPRSSPPPSAGLVRRRP